MEGGLRRSSSAGANARPEIALGIWAEFLVALPALSLAPSPGISDRARGGMYLGIDIGTSSVKAVIVDDKDTVVEQASAPLNVSRPQAGWSEQNPADWWAATNAAVAALPAQHARRCRPLGSPARCTAQRCSTPTTSRCARPSSGMTAAAKSSAPRSRRPSRAPARSPATSPCPDSPRRSWCGCARTSPPCSSTRAACCCPRIMSAC